MLCARALDTPFSSLTHILSDTKKTTRSGLFQLSSTSSQTTMFTNITPGMSIAVSGGNAEENAQLCTVLSAALRNSGFRNVQLDAGSEYPSHTHHDADTILAMRRLNPDLFDMPVVVAGESEDDMRLTMAAMGISDAPFAFQVERPTIF